MEDEIDFEESLLKAKLELPNSSSQPSTTKHDILMEGTPTSSKSTKEGFRIKGRALKFEGPDSVLPIQTVSAKCSSCPKMSPKEVRPPAEDEWSFECGEAGHAEVMALCGNIPEHARNYVLYRKAAILPVYCSVCKRWRAPFYRCRFCGDLKYGPWLEFHEGECTLRLQL